MASQQQKIQHLFLRAGFGETPAKVEELKNFSLEQIVEKILLSSKKNQVIDFINDPRNENQDEATNFQIVMMVLKSRKEMEDLNIVWMYRMLSTDSVLREKMTFFWHNHFSTSVPFAYLMQMQNNTIRKHALGKFSDLLFATAKDPAMLLYLNNHENKKDAPNENFAREVMELFTLGEGNYSEKDIKEAARAFTGWTTNRKGEYEFREKDHDGGEKEFFGRKGNFNGEDILKILLEQNQTSYFITQKIYKEFVNSKPNHERIKILAESFFNSGYDISNLMKRIFNSEWFYDDENIGCKITSPVELLVRYMRLFDVDFKNDKTLLALQKVLGQTLFFPPNVAGWKGGRNWIDSSSLLLRLNLAEMFLKNGYVDLKPKPQFEEQSPDGGWKQKRFMVKSNIIPVKNYFNKFSHQELISKIIESFIQCPENRIDKNYIAENTLKSPAEDQPMNIIIEVLSLPEFQLI